MRRLILFATTSLLLGSPAIAVELTFDERVQAQRAIDRVYFEHQKEPRRSFEEAVPLAASVRKVQKYLKQTVALERFWGVRIGGEALRREVERMISDTLMPGRLARIFAALEHDPVLIQECLARKTLVNRLSLQYFDHDSRFQERPRREAEQLREALADARRGRDVVAPPTAVATEITLAVGESGLGRDEFEQRMAELPDRAGDVSRVKETRDRFALELLVEREADSARVMLYEIPKIPWDPWWNEVSSSLDENSLEPAGDLSPVLPLPSSTPGSQGTTGEPESCERWDPERLRYVERVHSHEAVWTGTELLVWGGRVWGIWDEGGTRYDPLIDRWTEMSTTGAPSPRGNHTQIWTGSYMIVWGGFGFTYHKTGGRYDPATDSWTPTTLVGAPVARQGHTAVWTGEEMIVWGGSSSGSMQSTGARYDPLQDEWTPTTLAGAPTARRDHTAVWTGDEMIVWGGGNSTGARFDPLTDSWSEMSTNNAPSSRWFNTAVWTGDRMIVAGGSYLSCVDDHPWDPTLASVVAYDPEADVWEVLPLSHRRFGHSAVWTGTEMILWGGRTAGDFPQWFDTGVRYNPITEQEVPTSMVQAPSQRDRHSAIWTGTEMLVFGGGTGGWGATSAGWRYDPASDVWSATSFANAARGGHGALWTGDTMLVWGGGDASGDRYDPVTNNWTPMTDVGSPNLRYEPGLAWTGEGLIVWGGGLSPAIAGGGFYTPDGVPHETAIRADRVGPSTARLTWAPLLRAESYAVTRGELSDLGSSDYGSCLDMQVAALTYDDPEVPASGQGFAYLVQAANATCGAGSLGTNSWQSERVNTNQESCY